MDIHPAALTEGVTRQGVYNAVERALITTHIGNEPTRLLVIGENGAGRLLEMAAVVRHEDILIVHAAGIRPEYLPLLDDPSGASPSSPSAAAAASAGGYGKSADGLELTDTLIKDLFIAAEHGYEVARLTRRTRPGRPAPLTVGGVVNVGLDQPLKEAVSTQAAADHVAESDLIQRVLREYLSASN